MNKPAIYLRIHSMDVSSIHHACLICRQAKALNRVAMKQFFEEQLAKWLQPSQARFVYYH